MTSHQMAKSIDLSTELLDFDINDELSKHIFHVMVMTGRATAEVRHLKTVKAR